MEFLPDSAKRPQSRRDDEQTTPPDPRSGLQSESGPGRAQGQRRRWPRLGNPTTCQVGQFRNPRHEHREYRLLEELFIHLLDVQSLLDAAADAVADHQAGELVAVDEHNSVASRSACRSLALPARASAVGGSGGGPPGAGAGPASPAESGGGAGSVCSVSSAMPRSPGKAYGRGMKRQSARHGGDKRRVAERSASAVWLQAVSSEPSLRGTVTAAVSFVLTESAGQTLSRKLRTPAPRKESPMNSVRSRCGWARRIF